MGECKRCKDRVREKGLEEKKEREKEGKGRGKGVGKHECLLSVNIAGNESDNKVFILIGQMIL